ncbi:MAG: hypothetical protein OXT70_02140 [Chloroflexota bacterium]|nr:hypothetical protein [Chloroflexota bacterium]
MAGRSDGTSPVGLVVGCLILFTVTLLFSSCGDDDSSVPDQPQTVPEVQEEDVDPPVVEQPAEQTVRERQLTVTSADVGAHLEEKSYAAGLPSWLEASEDRSLSSLPGRSLTSSGIAFSPSDESPTGETFWLHVFTDQSEESAADWVKYVASQPPDLAGVIVPHHRLFASSFLPAPLVGDASVAIELYRGHAGICVRSALLVFAQGRDLVFLFTSIEITTDDTAPADGGGRIGLPAHCDESAVDTRLTDLNAIAELISERLAADP